MTNKNKILYYSLAMLSSMFISSGFLILTGGELTRVETGRDS